MREDRLNALSLLFIHKDVALDYDAIIDERKCQAQQEKDDIYQAPAMNFLMIGLRVMSLGCISFVEFFFIINLL